MLLSKTLVSTSVAEPVSVAEVKVSARLDSDLTALDGQIAILIPAARIIAEQETSRQFAEQTWLLQYSDWPDVDLPLSPVSEIVKVEYFDGANWLESDHFTLGQAIEGRGYLLQTAEGLPSLLRTAGARVRVTAKVGYATCPANVKAWIIAMCVHWLTNPDGRSAKAPGYLDGLLDAERDWQ